MQLVSNTVTVTEAQTSFAVAKFLNAFSSSFTGSLRTLGRPSDLRE